VHDGRIVGPGAAHHTGHNRNDDERPHG
jgi:hypothetical protein